MAARRTSTGAVVTVARLGVGGGRLREAANIIADRARLNAAVWSRRIPGSVTVKVSGDGTIAVINAGGPRAPQAYTFENPYGGLGVWHPVYGHGPRSTWHWARQTPRPFLAPAGDEAADEAARAWGEGITGDWARDSRF